MDPFGESHRFPLILSIGPTRSFPNPRRGLSSESASNKVEMPRVTVKRGNGDQNLMNRFLCYVLVASCLVVPASLAWGGNHERPPRVSIFTAPPRDFPYPAAVRMLFERALDCRRTPFEPVTLPDRKSANLAHVIVSHGEGAVEGGSGSFLRSEGRSSQLDYILVAALETGREGVFVNLYGSATPFDSIWVALLPPVPLDSLGKTAQAWADSAIVRFGWTAGEERSFPLYDLQAEELFARGVATGSLGDLEEAWNRGSHEGAKAELGYRLADGEYPARGRKLLAETDSLRLAPLERAAHQARILAIAGNSRARTEAIDRLESQFPLRFDTHVQVARMRAEEGDFRGAAEQLRAAIRLRSLDPRPHRLLGDFALRAGYLDMAREEFHRADELSGGDALARIGLASIDYSEGFPEDAALLLSHPPSGLAHGWTAYYQYAAARAALHLARGFYGEAVIELKRGREEAHRLGNQEAVLDLTARLVWALLEADEPREAAYEAADLRFHEESQFLASADPGLIPFLEGIVAARFEDRGAVSAKRLELEAIGHHPARAPFVEGLYFLRIQSGWEAVPPLRRAVRISDTVRNRYYLGLAYLGADQAARAIQELETVVERGESLLDFPPVLPDAFAALGRALESRGSLDLAITAYEEYLNYRSYGDPAKTGVPIIQEAITRARKNRRNPYPVQLHRD